MAKQDDSLFLLEVLIDKIIFEKSPCFSDKDFRTCVNIEASAVEPLEICDDDPGVCVAKSGGPFVKTFNSGKSCLFSLKEPDIAAAMSKFPIKVSVYKSLPCGCLPTKIVMGEATIDMTKEFVQARKKFLEDPATVSYQALKDSFRITGPDGVENGEILMFLRISCFGKLIITRFQGVGGPPNLGAGGGSTIVDRSCNPRRDFQSALDPCACGTGRAAGAGTSAVKGPPCMASGGSGGAGGPCPIARDPYNSMPCEGTDDICYCSGPKPAGKPPMVCRNTDQYCLHVPKDCCPTGSKLVFQLPSDTCGMGHKQRAYFDLTSDGIGDVSRDEPGQLLSPASPNYPGVIYDYQQQVIKLRIGKTVEMANRKSKLEYQFITPAVAHDKIVPVRDTRTAQCVPTCPDCCPVKSSAFPRLPLCQELSEDQIKHIKVSSWKVNTQRKASSQGCDIKNFALSYKDSQANVIVKEILHILVENLKLLTKLRKSQFDSIITFCTSASSMSIQRSKRRSVSFSDSVNFIAGPRSSFSSMKSEESTRTSVFSNKETTVYMTLFDEFCFSRTSGTQATASINKCLQVANDCKDRSRGERSRLDTESDFPANIVSTQSGRAVRGVLRNSDVYFFGRKKDQPQSGKDSSDSKTRLRRKENITAAPVKSEQRKSSGSISVQAKTQGNSASAQTNNARGSSASTCTNKGVSIKESKNEPCPAVMGCTKGDMMATVSHIRIGPSQPCPIHGREPCQGPKCIVASAAEEQQVPVKVSTVTNPRRGVFELVIRRMTGAPLAKNELMLEWTPPLSRPPPCGTPCIIPCSHPTCRPSKCKMIVCRPSPCKTRCCKKSCKKPCVLPCRLSPCRPSPCRPSPCRPSLCRPAPCCPSPCRPSPCRPSPCRPLPCRPSPCRPARSKKSCRYCCKKSCLPCKPCSYTCKPCPPLPRCKPCSPLPACSPCPSPRYKICPISARYGPSCESLTCCDSPCGSCCSSSPCLRPCPVGRRKPRKARSQPRMKPRKKRISPCFNRSITCPAVRCSKSMAGPCIACCVLSPPCLPRKSCSVFPFKPLCSQSNCSTRCG